MCEVILKSINILRRKSDDKVFFFSLFFFSSKNSHGDPDLSQDPVGRITKTYLYNVDPRQPHLYIVQLGFTGVYIIFLISAQNIDCGTR